LGQEGSKGRADVIVLANRAEEDVRFTIASGETNSRAYTIVKGDVIALPVTRDVEIVFPAAGTRTHCHARRDEVYYFIASAKQLPLKQVGFTGMWRQPQQLFPGDDKERSDQSALPSHEERENKDRSVLKVPVKLLVDQAEPNVQLVWEKRLRQRVEDASD